MVIKKRDTVGCKIFRAFAIVLAVCLWFDCQLLSSHACYKQYKTCRSWHNNYLLWKTAVSISFLTRIILRARIILLPTVTILYELHRSWRFSHMRPRASCFLVTLEIKWKTKVLDCVENHCWKLVKIMTIEIFLFYLKMIIGFHIIVKFPRKGRNISY